jgi:plastocyanin domain-containing protein
MRALILISSLLLVTACKEEKASPPAAAPVAVKPAVEAAKPAEPAKPAGPRVVEMAVTDDGFVPANVTLKANEPVTFRVTRKTDETCAKDLLIEGTDIKLALPLNTPVEVAWTPTKAGKVKFGCAMEMMVGGVLLVE